jgi:hypothetical protein
MIHILSPRPLAEYPVPAMGPEDFWICPKKGNTNIDFWICPKKGNTNIDFWICPRKDNKYIDLWNCPRKGNTNIDEFCSGQERPLPVPTLLFCQ